MFSFVVVVVVDDDDNGGGGDDDGDDDVLDDDDDDAKENASPDHRARLSVSHSSTATRSSWAERT